MFVPAPKIDRRDMDAILNDVRAFAPMYVPEWDASEETGADAALLKVYAKLLEGLIRRLNDVPLKNFIAFLDMLGVRLLPAQPARAPLTFFLSTGAKDAVAIPARSQAAATPAAGGDPVVFETERSILATPAKLQSFYSVVPKQDQIFNHTSNLLPGSVVAEVFSDSHPNQQEHSIYIAHGDLFNLKSAASIGLKFSPPVSLDELNLLKTGVSWQYYGERVEALPGQKTKKEESWFNFNPVDVKDGKLILTKNNQDELKQTKINKTNSRWIRGRVKSALLAKSPLTLLTTTKIDLTIAPYSPTTDAGMSAGVLPDAAVYNDIPLELPPSATNLLLPFGPRPRQGDIFYLASQEAFSKKGTLVTIHVKAALRDVENGAAQAVMLPKLVWEYWNTKGWTLIKKTPNAIFDGTNNFSQEGDVSFIVPDDIAPTQVSGQDNYWIRVRIAFGDYGQEAVVRKQTANANGDDTPEFELDTSNIHPPEISELKINYDSGQPPELVITFNNGEYVTPTVDNTFAPFVPLEDEHQAIYLGFDQPPLKGPISIFFSLTEQEYTEEMRPRVEWEYFRKRPAEQNGEWARLLINDGTRNLTESGTIEFIGPEDFTQASRFGTSLYWIRAVDVEDKFQPLVKVMRQRRTDRRRRLDPRVTSRLREKQRRRDEMLFSILLDRNPSADINKLELSGFGREVGGVTPTGLIERTEGSKEGLTQALADKKDESPCVELALCDETLETLHPQFGLSAELRGVTFAPLIQGIYLNTAWASQAETIPDEIVGSSSGNANQKYTLTKFPVIEEAIWVNELGTLTESERKTLAEQPEVETEEKKDDTGKAVAFWIRWRRIDDLGEAPASDRVYSIDPTFGLIEFGDGTKGRVPPIGRDNIRANYRAGGGTRGNVAAGEIKVLRTTIPFVERVANKEAAGGGSDTELIENALERGPQMIKNRGRATTADDFEWLAHESSRGIARTKCLPTFNDEGEFATGWVTVIIVPNTTDARPVPSPQLRQRVEKYLSERAANVVSFPRRVKVSAPVYVEVKITADVFPITIDLAPTVEANALKQLAKFLHPLTGGYTGRGWEFGRLPCLSDFYALLEAIEGVDHIESPIMALQAVTPNGIPVGTPRIVTEERPLSVNMPEYTLLFSGEHKITAKALG